MRKLHLLVLLFLSSNVVYSQYLENRKEPVFKVGEELKYKLRYGFVTAAEATLSVRNSDLKFNNQSVYHLLAEGRTSGTFDVFHKVRNRYNSYIHPTQLLPFLYTETIREGNYRRNDKARYHQEEKKVVSNKGTFFGKRSQLFDIVSAYYFARSLDLSEVKQNEKFKMTYFLNDGLADLEIIYIGKERVKTSMGYFNCLKFNPSIQAGRVFREDSKLYLWITDDGNRIPVKAQVEILVGTVTMELTSAKGLKYPLDVTKIK
ncbi:DUF3108 domain-containing protein [Pedobacter sp. P351]|uniref:DUF3108 domain-containing protein n=1 Tax=Pedobacter superstes TaxID=3133441 RepID=UPI00309CC1A4